jgi:BirA family biotin operon repressor/biotin-[acetyl-CoA-carboxylase] ligase
VSTPLQDRLTTLAHVRRVHVADVVDSTNLVVARAAREGAGPGTVAVAQRQTAGRGRRGRSWADVPGGNVALSIGVAMPARGAGRLSLAAALALADVFGDLGLATSLKWPNDVHLVVDGGPRKAAGILLEALPAATPPVVVVGLGVDVDWRGVDRSTLDAGEVAADWTSVAEAREAAGSSGDVDRDDLVVALVAAVESRRRQLAEAPDELLADYRTACATVGQRVRVDLGTRRVEGWATDVDASGALVVATDRGHEVVTAGDVVHVRDA